VSPAAAPLPPEDDDALLDRLRHALRCEADAVVPFSGRARSIAAIHDWAARRRRRRHRAMTGAAGLVAICLVALSAAVIAGRADHSTSVGVTAPTSTRSGDLLRPPQDNHTPSSRPTPSALGAVPAGAVPAGFEPLSATFVTPAIGYVLGTASCGSARCPLLASTTDGGSTWASLGDPDPSTSAGLDLGSPTSVHLGVRFADQEHGWIYGYLGSTPVLWWTSDAGTTWSDLQPSALAGGEVAALEAMDGRAQAIVVRGEPSGVQVVSTPKTSPVWKTVSTILPAGHQGNPSPQLALQGSSGWLVEQDPTFVTGARLTRYGTWQRWSPPCATTSDRVLLAAPSATEVLALCQPAGSDGDASVYRSERAGNPGTWTQTARTPYGLDPQAFAANTADSFALAGQQSGRAVIELHTPTSPIRAAWSGSGGFTQLGFEDPAQGIAMIRSADASSMLMTYDGGSRWSQVDFQRSPASS
jgi:hypothetical protein